MAYLRPLPIIALIITLLLVHMQLNASTFVDSEDSKSVQERKAALPPSDQSGGDYPAEYASFEKDIQSLKQANEAATLKLVKLATALRLMIQAIGGSAKGGGTSMRSAESDTNQEKPHVRNRAAFLAVAAVPFLAKVGAIFTTWVIPILSGLGTFASLWELFKPSPKEKKPSGGHQNNKRRNDDDDDDVDDRSLDKATDRSLAAAISASEKRLESIYASMDTLLEEVHQVNSRSMVDSTEAKKIATTAQSRLNELFTEARHEMARMRALCEQSGAKCL